MKNSMLVSIILGLLMVSSSAITKVVTPTAKVIDLQDRIDLKAIIPATFGDWEIDESIVPLQVSPEIQKRLAEAYNQTLARTYVNRMGQRVMLSVAYGGDQSGNLALHKPEACYGAQGFEISNFFRTEMVTEQGTFPVTRLLAVQGNRHEPITYWTTVGDKAVKNGVEQKLQKLRYAMTGKIPDGMLVRVSTISTDDAESYRLQNAFIKDMLSAIAPKNRTRIIGTLGT
ncbi:MAG: exosortase-associated protein EpsI, B-type [Burkholderiaceae bacterium]